jgi:ubiquitin carboxyl-terminal hydrolase 4/11/15
VLREFNKKRPSFMVPGTFLEPQLQNLFELSYFYDSSDSFVPSGWSQVENYRTLPKLADRMPKPSVESDQGSPESWDSTSANDESGKEENSPKAESDATQTRMAEESSEEEPSHHVRSQPTIRL